MLVCEINCVIVINPHIFLTAWYHCG